MKIVNCFPYFNEIELLELRLKLLYDHIDHFIICDADRTHTGKPKPFTCKDALKKLNFSFEKISVIEVNLPNKTSIVADSFRENLQRDLAEKLISKDDIIFVTDCDEIINPEFIKFYAGLATSYPKNIVRIPMYFLCSRADLRIFDNNKNPISWNSPYVCLYDHLADYSLTQIREAESYNNKINYPSLYVNENNKVQEAGWHFSWMGNNNRRLDKFTSFMHANDHINSSIGDKKDIINYIKTYSTHENNLDPLGRKDHILKKFPKNKLPRLIFDIPNIKNFLLPKRSWKDVDGFFEYPSFYDMIIRDIPENSVMVEVGAWMGRSTCYIAESIKNSYKQIKFYTVDNWKGSSEHINLIKNLENEGLTLFEIFMENINDCEVIDYVTPIKAESLIAAQQFNDNSIDFVHIDANHDYENVLADIQAWYPKVKSGGLITGDDYGWPGVFKAVNEFFGQENIIYFDHDNKNGNVWLHKKQI